MELTRAEWEIPRARQDEVALASHRHAVAARERLAREIVPVGDVTHDTGPRPDSSMERLAVLKPAFDPAGTITAGNASPVTDGASAVLLMSERRAAEEGREPLAFIEAMEYAALDPKEGLLMAPAITVPRLLKRASLELADIDLIEVHEAFAAQVLANVAAWECGWGGRPTGSVDWTRVNVNGSSVAIGHPWAATGRPDPHDPRLRDEAAQRPSGIDQHMCRRRNGGGGTAHAGLRKLIGPSRLERSAPKRLNHRERWASLLTPPNMPATLLAFIHNFYNYDVFHVSA